MLTICLGVNSFAQDEIWIKPNQGQWHDNVTYRIDIPGGKMYLEDQGFTYALTNNYTHYHEGHGDDHEHTSEDLPSMHAVKTTFLGSNPNPTYTNLDPSPFYENYFLGNDPSKWVTHSKAYEKIIYHQVYDGIDLQVYKGQSTLKYDIIVDPGTDPSLFRVAYEGQDKLHIVDGALVIETELGIIREEQPVAFQETGMGKMKIACEYILEGNEMYFYFPDGYDTTKTLIIDPDLNFSTFTGATSDNWGMTACPDINGMAIGGGIVFGTGYPTSAGAFDTDFNGADVDVGITKFNADGSGILFSTFLGGNGSETPHSIIVNNANELYVMGATSSDNFPVGPMAYQNSHNGGDTPFFGINGIDFSGGTDIFITKLSPGGDALLGGTYLGGDENDGISADGDVAYNYGDELRGEIYVDDASNVYVASTSESSDFPIVGGFDGTLSGGKDAVVAKLNSNLTSLLWSTYLGGSGDESGNSIKVSPSGDLFVAGGTTSNDFPNTGSGVHPSYGGGSVDGYVMRFPGPTYAAPNGTYLGTSDYDQAYFVDLDIDEFVYVYGQSAGSYDTDGPNYINANSGQFIHKLTNDLGTTEWASVFGASTGNTEISPTAFLVSDCYEIYIAGWGGNTNTVPSTTDGFPTTGDAYQSVTSGSNFYLAVFDENMQNLKYGTFMGDPSSGGDHVDGGTSRFDKSGTIYHSVCAACSSNDWPTTPGVFSEDNGSGNCNMAVFQFELGQIDATLSTGVPVVCIPDPVIFENSSTNGDTYFWDFGDGTTSTEFEPTHFYTEPGIYEVMLVVSDAAGCYTPDTAYLEVEIQLFEGEAGALSDTICPGTSVELYATGGDSYSWGPAEDLDNPSTSNPIATIDEETTFTVLIESVCGETELEVTVYVFDVSGSAWGDTAICVGEEATLHASGGDTYEWEPPETLDDPTSSDPVASPPFTTYYEVTITTEEGCLIEDTVKVRVDHDLPFPSLIDTARLCYGDSVRITAGGAFDYLWTPDYMISDPTLYNPYISTDVDTTYVVAFSNACGTTYDSVFVDVIVLNGIVSKDTTICPGGTAALWASGGMFYDWSPSAYLSNPDAASTTSTPPHEMTYTVFITDEFGCMDSGDVNVYLYEPPFIEVSAGAFPVVGDTVNIWANSEGTIAWTPPYNIACTTCFETFVWPESNTSYTATVTDENGCTNSATVPITFEPLIYVPNAFTPDGDSFNNEFKAIAHNIKDFKMYIFNRWGELIYVMDDLQDAWDGSYKGSLVLDDVYVWQIVYKDLEDIQHELRGHVTLLK